MCKYPGNMWHEKLREKKKKQLQQQHTHTKTFIRHVLTSLTRLQNTPFLMAKNGCHMYRQEKLPVKSNIFQLNVQIWDVFCCCRQRSSLSCQMKVQSLAFVFIKHIAIIEQSLIAHLNTRIISPYQSQQGQTAR